MQNFLEYGLRWIRASEGIMSSKTDIIIDLENGFKMINDNSQP